MSPSPVPDPSGDEVVAALPAQRPDLRTLGQGLARVRAHCPYLLMADGASRASVASRDHRCAAIRPATPISLDKQRRLCTSDDHRTCATFAAASERAGGATAGDVTTTRWALTRTTPIVLDHGALPASVAGLGRDRRTNQVALGALMVVALAAVLVARFPIAGGAPAIAESPSPTPPASAVPSPAVSAVPSPSPSPAPATPSPTPATATQSATPVAPSPSPTVVASSSATGGVTYRVQPGDTLYGIAVRFGTTVQALMDANGITDARLIHIGQVLTIPAAAP